MEEGQQDGGGGMDREMGKAERGARGIGAEREQRDNSREMIQRRGVRERGEGHEEAKGGRGGAWR